MGRLTLWGSRPLPTTCLMSAARLDFRMEDSCPPHARRSVTAVYTGTMGPQNLSICQIREWRSDLWTLSSLNHWTIHVIICPGMLPKKQKTKQEVPVPALWVMKSLLTPEVKIKRYQNTSFISCHISTFSLVTTIVVIMSYQDVKKLNSSTLYWQLGAVWSWRRTPEVLSGRPVWSIPEISVTDGTLVQKQWT